MQGVNHAQAGPSNRLGNEAIRALLDMSSTLALGGTTVDSLPVCCDARYVSCFTSLSDECGELGTRAKEAISKQLVVQLLMVVAWLEDNQLLHFLTGKTGAKGLKPLGRDLVVELYLSPRNDPIGPRVPTPYSPDHAGAVFLAYHCQWLNVHPPTISAKPSRGKKSRKGERHPATWDIVGRLSPATPFLIPASAAGIALDEFKGSANERATLEAILRSHQHVAYANAFKKPAGLTIAQVNLPLKAAIAAAPVLEILLRSSLQWDHWVRSRVRGHLVGLWHGLIEDLATMLVESRMLL